MRGTSEKKLVSLEEGVADFKVRRKNRISIAGDFRVTLSRERKRWMKKRENANGICGCFTRTGTLLVSFTTVSYHLHILLTYTGENAVIIIIDTLD